jgi:hypothetical protein
MNKTRDLKYQPVLEIRSGQFLNSTFESSCEWECLFLRYQKGRNVPFKNTLW